MRTLTDEYLPSVQETRIVNFLYLNGLDYEYEPVYPHEIPGAKKKYTPDFLIQQSAQAQRFILDKIDEMI